MNNVVISIIDSPLNLASTEEDVVNWITYLETLPDTEQKINALQEAQNLLEFILA